MYQKALHIAPLSLTVPYLAFTPVMILVTAFFLLGEVPTLWGATGGQRLQQPLLQPRTRRGQAGAPVVFGGGVGGSRWCAAAGEKAPSSNALFAVPLGPSSLSPPYRPPPCMHGRLHDLPLFCPCRACWLQAWAWSPLAVTC